MLDRVLLLVVVANACGPGCFRSGTLISTPDGRRASPADTMNGDGLRVTSQANLIVLDETSLYILDCPSNISNSELRISSDEPIDPAMFEDEPFVAAGAKFSCTGQDGHIAPFYLRITGEPAFDTLTNTIKASVRRAHFTEMIYGRAHVEQGMAETETEAMQHGERRSASELPLGTAPAKILPPTGCVYSDSCATLVELVLPGGDECPASHPYSNVLSLSSLYDNSGATVTCPEAASICTPAVDAICTPAVDEYCTPAVDAACTPAVDEICLFGVCTPAVDEICTPAVDAICTPAVDEICTPAVDEICTPGVTQFKYHCCDETHKNKLHWGYEKSMVYNMNYDTATQDSVSSTSYNDGMFTTDNFAYMDLKAVVDVDIAASQFDALTGFLDNALIPTGINSLDAYLEGTAEMQVKGVMNAGTYTYGTMLGPYQVLGETPVADVQFMLGIFPVKLTLGFSMHATLEADIAATLPYPLEFYAKASGSIKFGGSYDGTAFSKYDEREFSYEFKKAEMTQALKDTELDGTITVTVTPTVHVTLYDLVPFDFQFNVYAGVDFVKYSENHGTIDRKCPGTAPDLRYDTFYGVDMGMRVRQIVLPDAWTITDGAPCSDSSPCFGGLALVCLTSSQSYYGGLLTGSTVIKTTESQCDDSGTTCTCLQYPSSELNDARMFGASSATVYWLKYPQNGLLTVVEKTYIPTDVCSECSGCVDLSAFYEAVSKFESNIDDILDKLDGFIVSFVATLVTLINDQLAADVPPLDESMISGVSVCLAASAVDSKCPAVRRAIDSSLTSATPRRGSDEVQVDFSITPTEGIDARLYEDAAATSGPQAAATAVTMLPVGEPTPPPTLAAGTSTITHAMTVSHLDTASDYTVEVATVYNVGYAFEIGIATLAGVYEDGCSVTSTASDARRGNVALTFVAVASPSLADSANANAAAVSASSLAGSFSSAAAALGSTVPLPSASDITGLTYTQTTASGNSESSDSLSVAMIAVIVVACVAFAVLAAAASVMAVRHFRNQNPETKDTNEQEIKPKEGIEDVGVQISATPEKVETGAPVCNGQEVVSEEDSQPKMCSTFSHVQHGEDVQISVSPMCNEAKRDDDLHTDEWHSENDSSSDDDVVQALPEFGNVASGTEGHLKHLQQDDGEESKTFDLRQSYHAELPSEDIYKDVQRDDTVMMPVA